MEQVSEISNVRPLIFDGDDPALVKAIQNGHSGACTALYDRYVGHVRRVLTRILGVDSELADLTNEVFYQALKSMRNINEPERLKAWITKIAVFTARKTIRGRRKRNWLHVVAPEDLPDVGTAEGDEDAEATEAMDAVRVIIGRLPAQDQIVFALRYLDGMEIAEIADACGYSLRTAKRRMAACEIRFKKLASSYPVLHQYLGRSRKWRNR